MVMTMVVVRMMVVMMHDKIASLMMFSMVNGLF
ncbi:hypothetical protein GA8_14855 [Geobacillus sp. A8]|nr:hypothetical protein GA8_14855 [Geobacillus sp. A8]